MKWYEGLSREQRDEVFGYTLGYLDSIATGTVANDADACIKGHAIQLLDHLKSEMKVRDNGKTREGDIRSL